MICFCEDLLYNLCFFMFVFSWVDKIKELIKLDPLTTPIKHFAQSWQLTLISISRLNILYTKSIGFIRHIKVFWLIYRYKKTFIAYEEYYLQYFIIISTSISICASCFVTRMQFSCFQLSKSLLIPFSKKDRRCEEFVAISSN